MKRFVGWVLFFALCAYLSTLVFFGGDFSFKKFRLENGEVVECRLKFLSAGTVCLNFCKDGQRYLAQKNVVQIQH